MRYLILILILIPRICQARDISLSYGENIVWWQNMNSKGVKVKTMEVEIKDKWTEHLDICIVGNNIQSYIKEGHIIDGRYFEGKDKTFIVSGRLSAHKEYKNLLGRVYGGIGFNTENHFPGFGDSGIISHFGIAIGVRLDNICTLEYGLSHWSDPLRHGDRGHNFQYIGLSVRF